MAPGPSRGALSVATVLLLACVLAATAVAQPRAKPPVLRIGLPSAGHVTVAAVKMKVTGKRRGFPKRLTLKPRGLKALPPSVRVIWARRAVRTKRATTYHLAVL